MVLATEITRPMITPCKVGQPSRAPTPRLSATQSAMPSGPPRRATQRTRVSSRSENSMPMENIRRITPISANSSKVWTSETVGPGVNGPMRMPPKT